MLLADGSDSAEDLSAVFVTSVSGLSLTLVLEVVLDILLDTPLAVSALATLPVNSIVIAIVAKTATKPITLLCRLPLIEVLRVTQSHR